MHLIEPIRICVDDIIRATGSGMKAMVLDEFTTSVIGSAYGRSEMLLREVYLFEYIDSMFESTERLNNLKCILILRPTKENVQLLCEELNHPHYRTYYLYFTGRVGSVLIKKLAEADEREVLRTIKEIPMDFSPVNPFTFHLKLVNKTFDLRTNNWSPDGLKRSCDGLVSLLIALQLNPLIRYQTQSALCKSLAEKVSNAIKSEYIANKTWKNVAPFDPHGLLIIMDRRCDLVTPIIHSWSYYPMIHNELNITNNRINLENVPNRQPKDPREMILSIENDQFFKDNYYKNFGELGPTLLGSVENLKLQTKSQHQVETLADMKRFIDEYPETKRHASDLHNHVFLMSEIGRIVNDYSLMLVSECEQELACHTTSHNEIVKKTSEIICSSKVRSEDALRLVCLDSICNPDRSSSNLVKLLKTRVDISTEDVDFVKKLRQFRLSKPQNPVDATVQRVAQKIVQGVKGVENTLTQFCPSLHDIIGDLRRGNKLKETDFAFVGQRYRDEPPKKIVVYIVGGVTYEEALVVDQFNRLERDSCKIIIGGSSIHNFKSFKDEVHQAVVDNK